MRAIKTLCWILGLLPSLAAAQIYNSHTQQWVDMDQVAQEILPGDILVIGEQHDHPGHHHNQLKVMTRLWEKGLKINLGMEFFEYPSQPMVDQYLTGEIAEKDFLKSVNWGGFPYDWYRLQVLFPLHTGGHTYAINAPRALTSKIAKGGLDSLTPEESDLLPPQFQPGNELYFRRFAEVMGGHVPEEALMRYFTAQSLWDDTMAWQTLNRHGSDSMAVFVIIVGDFHAAYGGGLPDRLRARGARRVKVISQMDSTDWDQKQVEKSVQPHPIYEKRADWIWLTDREASE